MFAEQVMRRAMVDNIGRDQLIAAIVYHLRMTVGIQGGTLRDAYSSRFR